MSNVAQTTQSAPSHDIVQADLLSVEHPFIVGSTEQATNTLGGPPKVNGLADVDGIPSTIAESFLYIRPGHRYTKPIRSCNVATQNFLLQVTLPKRTGLKRKRGSIEPYQRVPASDAQLPDGNDDESQNVTRFLRSYQDNTGRGRVKVSGPISQTHRFRSLPDFAVTSSGRPFLKKMQDHVLPFDYNKLKDFKLDMATECETNAEIIPPPALTHFTVPFNYGYRQNPGVRSHKDAQGNLITTNSQIAPRLVNRPLPFDAPSIPAGPSPDLPPEDTLEPTLRTLIAQTRKAFQQRPIYTRRSLPNFLPGSEWYTVGQSATKVMFQYVGYVFASGPWRDAVVKFGVDPRTDPKYRIYQTMMFMIEPEPKAVKARHGNTSSSAKTYSAAQSKAASAPNQTPAISDRLSHIFDGKSISKDGKVWQVCDITDPVLADLLATTDLRAECQTEGDGWYHNGLWAKAKTIMKWKINAVQSSDHRLTDTQYRRVAAALPNIIRKGTTVDLKSALSSLTALERTLASQIRTASNFYRLGEGNKRILKDTYEDLEDPTNQSTPDPGRERASEEAENEA